MNKKRLIFITIGERGYSRSWTYFAGIQNLGETAEFIKINSKTLIKDFLQIKKKVSNNCIFIVMSPSQYLVPFVRFFLGKNIVLDAGWSLFEGTVISRKRHGALWLNIIKIYFIDYVASLFAKKIILESNLQKSFYSRLFLVRKSKCFVLYSGVDEEAFNENEYYKTPTDFFNNSKIVLFRGKYIPESGIEILAEATKALKTEPITFWVFSPGLPENITFSSNTIVNRFYLNSKSDLAKVYNSAALTLGQLSDHKRLKRTIPHKAFESAFLSKPYLTARNFGINELFSETQEVECFNAGDPLDLALKIKFLLNQPDTLKFLANNMHTKYKSHCSQLKLSEHFLEIVKK